MNLSAVAAVIRFEVQRMMTTSRMLGWCALTAFPPLITLLLVIQGQGPSSWQPIVLFVLIPMVLCLLSLLLWITPLVFSEIEKRSWIYLASRPGGRTAVLLGKYVAGVLRTVVAGWIAVTLSVLISWPDQLLRVWGAMFLLVVMASLAYGAVFALIGVMFHRRATVIAAGYVLIMEVVVSLLPAVVNQLTVQYYLRSIYTNLLGRRLGMQQFSESPAWIHVSILMITTVAVLFLTNAVLNRSQYAKADDGNV